jgi:dihydropteroate synthase
VLGGLPEDQRVEGTAATVALAIAQGADIVRVHDVREMARVARMADAVVRGWQP